MKRAASARRRFLDVDRLAAVLMERLSVMEDEAPAFGDMFLSARDQRETDSSSACAEGAAFTP